MLFHAPSLGYSATAEIISLSVSESVQQVVWLPGALNMIFKTLASFTLVQMDVKADQFASWICVDYGQVSKRASVTRSTWNVRLRIDRPGVRRIQRHVYVEAEVSTWGEDTQWSIERGIGGETLDQFLIAHLCKQWREAHEAEDLDLMPILPNTRIWMKGDPSFQLGYSEKGAILEFDNATLPEPQEHYLSYDHLIPPPEPDPEKEAAEAAEDAEMMKMPLDERVAHLSAIAQEANRRKRIERGEE
jgi:hypothetical protein